MAKVSTYYHHQFRTLPFQGTMLAGQDFPDDEEAEKAEGWNGDTPFVLVVEDNGDMGDGVRLTITFQPETGEREIFWAELSLPGARHLHEALGTILRARKIEQEENDKAKGEV